MQHEREKHYEYIGPVYDCERHPLIPFSEEYKIDEKTIKAIESILAKGNRVELIPVKNGVKIIHIKREEVKAHDR